MQETLAPSSPTLLARGARTDMQDGSLSLPPWRGEGWGREGRTSLENAMPTGPWEKCAAGLRCGRVLVNRPVAEVVLNGRFVEHRPKTFIPPIPNPSPARREGSGDSRVRKLHDFRGERGTRARVVRECLVAVAACCAQRAPARLNGYPNGHRSPLAGEGPGVRGRSSRCADSISSSAG